MVGIIIILAPVFLLIAAGYIFGRTPLFDEKSAKALIAFVWYVAVPALLFRFMAGRALPLAELQLMVAYYSAMLAVYVLAVLVGRFVFRQPLQEQGMFAFASCFANAAFVGLPIMQGAYGNEGVRLLLILLSFHSLTLLTVTTVMVESHRQRENKAKFGLFRLLTGTLLSVRSNPVVMSLLVGLVWSALHLPYPQWLDSVLSLPASAAAPVGLFAVGLSLTNVRLAGDLPQAGTGVLIKSLVMPVTIYLLGLYVFQLSPLWLGVATLFAAMPAGLIPYSFALQHDIAPRRVASMILISIILAPLSLFMVMAWLGVGG